PGQRPRAQDRTWRGVTRAALLVRARRSRANDPLWLIPGSAASGRLFQKEPARCRRSQGIDNAVWERGRPARSLLHFKRNEARRVSFTTKARRHKGCTKE